MQIASYERYVICACLIDRNAARIVVAELPDSAFAYGADSTYAEGHGLIYRAIIAVHLDGKAPDVGTVAAKLGRNLDKVGGIAYLTELTQALGKAGIHSTAGLPEWAGIVDKAGRLRKMSTILSTRLDQIVDIPAAMSRIDDVDTFLADVLDDLGAANTIRQEYQPIGDSVVAARQTIERQAQGETVNWFPIGWPAFDSYRLLPRRALFVLLGLTAIGKSQLLAQILLGAAIQLRYENLPGLCVLNTYEMGGAQYVLRMASCVAEVDLLAPELANVQSEEYIRLMGALDFIQELPIYVNDGDMTSAQIVNNARLLEAQHGGIPVFGIDYSELVPDCKENEEQRVTAIFRNAHTLARTLDACVLMLSQFPQEVYKDPHKLGIGVNPRYSGAGMHAAHTQAIIYNPPQMRRQHIEFTLPDGMEADYAYLVIVKNRDGKVGTIRLTWTPQFTRFADPQLTGYGLSTLYEHLADVRDTIIGEEEGDF